jgi:hypothetical protein
LSDEVRKKKIHTQKRQGCVDVSMQP